MQHKMFKFVLRESVLRVVRAVVIIVIVVLLFFLSPQQLITAVSDSIGAIAGALLGALLGILLYQWTTEKRLSTALIDELQDNKEALEHGANALELKPTSILTRRYHFDSYIAVRNAGILASLSKVTRKKLVDVYDELHTIDDINKGFVYSLASLKKAQILHAPQHLKRVADDIDDLLKDLKK
ncbi:MAG: hypothetical protein BME93_05770 [Methanosarcinales archaeon Met12]|nr:MAG: hypothetical protein BME93_05770 [Methanosarcinales archaeon Met12]